MTTPLEDLENELVNRPQQVLVIAGAGVSIATDPKNACAGWTGLIRHGLTWCQDRDPTLQSTRVAPYATLADSDSPNDLIAVASFIAEVLRSDREAEYARWLHESVGQLRVRDATVIQALLSWDVQIATTNYDTLIEDCCGKLPITWRDVNSIPQFAEGELSYVLHIHGQYRAPESVVFHAQSYEDILRDRHTQAWLQFLLMGRIFVFVGCGTGIHDPNFGRLLDWSRDILAHRHQTHFRLVRQNEIQDAEHECRGLSIKSIAYGRDHSDLGPFLDALASRVRARRTPPSELERLAGVQASYVQRRRQLAEERDSLTPSEFFRRQMELSQELWAAGGRRTAALDVNSAYFHEGAKLPIDEKVQHGLDVIEMLLDDDLPQQAAQVLQGLLPSMQSPDVPADGRRRLNELQIRCTNALCAYNETLAAMEAALLTATGDDRVRLQAQRAEVRLLQGDLEQAADELDEEEEAK